MSAQGWAAGILVVATTFFMLVFLLQKRSLINRLSAISRVAIITILVFFLGVSVWNWPVADDWVLAHAGRALGPFGFASESYQHWSGRLISSLLGACMGYFGNPVVVSRLFPTMLVTALACGIAWTIRGLYPSASAAVRWWTTGGLLVTWMVTMEWPAHGLFWFAATTNYAIGLPILMLLVGASFQIPKWSGWQFWLIAALGGLAIGGLAESFGLAVGMWTGCCWLGSRVPARSRFWLIVSLALVAGLCLNVLAPGTAERAAILHDHDGLTSGTVAQLSWETTSASWLRHGIGQMGFWVTNPFFWLGVVALAPVIRVLARGIAEKQSRSRVRLLLAWLMPLAVALSGELPAFFLVGHAPPWRARDAIQGVMLLAFIQALIQSAAFFRDHHPKRSVRDLWLVIAGTAGLMAFISAWTYGFESTFTVMAWLALSLFAGLLWWRHERLGASAVRRGAVGLYSIALLTASWFPSFVIDATILGPRWTAYQEGVQARLLDNPGRAVTIDPDPWRDRPTLLWYWGLGTNPNTWRNRSVATWYGVDSVRVGNDESPDETEVR